MITTAALETVLLLLLYCCIAVLLLYCCIAVAVLLLLLYCYCYVDMTVFPDICLVL